MESLERKKTQSKRERQREQKHRNLIQTIQYALYIGCAQTTLLYKSIWTDRSIDSYFNAHQWAPTLTPKIYSFAEYLPNRLLVYEPMLSLYLNKLQPGVEHYLVEGYVCDGLYPQDQGLVWSLGSINITVDDDEMMQIFLSNLTHKYGAFRTTIRTM